MSQHTTVKQRGLAVYFRPSPLVSNLNVVEYGYPYLKQSKEETASPLEISRLRDARFSGARHAKVILLDNKYYCFILAVDGNRRVLQNYEYLDRRGQKRSGIRLTDQRGTFICSYGIKICKYSQIYFENSQLSEYEVLGEDDGQAHYVFMIDGPFGLVTNRNSLDDASSKVINSDRFLREIKNFFDEVKSTDNTFGELIERLKSEHQSQKLANALDKEDKLKESLQQRLQFKVNDVSLLKNKLFVEPKAGEEHWIGALYTMFAHFVSPEQKYANIWLRPLTFSGIGVDSLVVGDEKRCLEPKTIKNVEYKFKFARDVEFNHPLIQTDQILCWEIDPEIREGSPIKDSFDYRGIITRSQELGDLGFEVTEIRNRSGQEFPRNINIVSLKKLLAATFDIKWLQPLFIPEPAKGRGNKSPKR